MNFEDIEKRIDYYFNDEELITLALTHKSYNPEYNYERLEFLGDAVIGAIVSEYLYLNFEDLSEGELSRRRSIIVSLENLYKIANNLKIPKFILMENIEEQKNKRIIGNVYEAVIGAIFLDSSYNKTKEVFLEHLSRLMPKVNEEIFKNKDFKTILQELVQKQYNTVPKYYTIKKEGPDHRAIFTICVNINNKILGYGSGLSKKFAEQIAASEALKTLQTQTHTQSQSQSQSYDKK